MSGLSDGTRPWKRKCRSVLNALMAHRWVLEGCSLWRHSARRSDDSPELERATIFSHQTATPARQVLIISISNQTNQPNQPTKPTNRAGTPGPSWSLSSAVRPRATMRWSSTPWTWAPSWRAWTPTCTRCVGARSALCLGFVLAWCDLGWGWLPLRSASRTSTSSS